VSEDDVDWREGVHVGLVGVDIEDEIQRGAIYVDGHGWIECNSGDD
jgi:hypothetical protein